MKKYLMYDSIVNTPDYLKACFSEDIQRAIEQCVQAIKERNIQRIVLTGCGTSMMIAQVAVHFLTEISEIPCFCQTAFELLHYPVTMIQKDDVIIGLSHSGGTKAVVDIINKYRKEGIMTIGMTEVPGSRLTEACEFNIIGPGGRDKPTPKTRSFSTGIMLALMLSLKLAGKEDDKLKAMPQKVANVLVNVENQVLDLVDKWQTHEKYVLVGSGTNEITAREAALKFLETANVATLSTSIEELAHGNELYLDESYSVFIICPKNCRGKTRLEQIIDGTITTKAHVCLITDDEQAAIPDHCQSIYLGDTTSELLSTFLFILPLQFFAYFLSVAKDLNPDLSTAVHEHMQIAIAKFHPPGYH